MAAALTDAVVLTEYFLVPGLYCTLTQLCRVSLPLDVEGAAMPPRFETPTTVREV